MVIDGDPKGQVVAHELNDKTKRHVHEVRQLSQVVGNIYGNKLFEELNNNNNS
jgi:hypothetical protein